jgi:hypothetical protein
MKSLARIPTLALSLLGLASCTSFEFEEQAIALRHVADGDALELRIVYLGLNPGDAKPEEAATTVAAIAEGARHFLLVGWPFEFSGDYFEKAQDESHPEAERRFARWLAAFEVVESGVFAAGEGRLCAWQVLRIPQISSGLEVLGRVVDQSVAEQLHREDPSAPFDDPALVPRFEEAARAGNYAWASFEKGALRVAFPISPAGMAQLARGLAHHSAEREGTPTGVLGALSSLDVREGEAVLRFEPDEQGWIDFHFVFPDRTASADLAARILARVPASEPPSWARELAR